MPITIAEYYLTYWLQIIQMEQALIKFRFEPKYFGHWCNDRIAVVGDYADGSNYEGPSQDHILQSYKDITDEVVDEFNRFIEDDKLKAGNSKAMHIDMMLVSNGVGKDPSILKDVKTLR